MTDAQAPGLPNAAVDFNKLHDNAAAGKSGDAMLDGVTLAKGEAKTAAPAAAKPVPKAAAKPAA